MASRIYLAFLVLILTQSIATESIGGRKLKPEVGREDCEWYVLNKHVPAVWTGAWQRDCTLDNQNKTIKSKSKTQSDLVPGLYDPCCTEYIGLICRRYTEGQNGEGYCGKPFPYHGDRKVTRAAFLKLMKKKKMDEGYDLDERWDNVKNSPPYTSRYQ